MAVHRAKRPSTRHCDRQLPSAAQVRQTQGQIARSVLQQLGADRRCARGYDLSKLRRFGSGRYVPQKGAWEAFISRTAWHGVGF